MANRKNRFLIKRSNVPNKVPPNGSLLLGELALNTADAKLYTSGTTANEIQQIGWDRIHRTGDTMTGDFIIDGDLTVSGTTSLKSTDVSTLYSNGAITATTYYGDGSNLTGIPDIYVTGGTSTGDTFTLTRNDDVEISVTLTGITQALKMKSGIANASGFTGNPKIFAVNFTTPFVDNNYSISITGEDSRSWSVDSKTSSGFTINANANPTFGGDVYWQAIKVGEN